MSSKGAPSATESADSNKANKSAEPSSSRQEEQEANGPPFDFSKFSGTRWTFKPAMKELGKRVFQEMTGNQTF